MEHPSTGLIARWPQNTIVHFAFLALGVAAVGFGIDNATHGLGSFSHIASVVILIVGGFAVTVGTFGYVDLYPDRLIMNGPLRRRSEIPLIDVDSVSTTTRSLALGTAEPSRWSRRHMTFGPYGVGVSPIGGDDAEVVDAIKAARDSARAESPDHG
jgi:hypothetical protein